ncbi:hypothetical protein FHW67_000706 [Herbaspirillum sp. Sphag1AN]|uniref:glycosyltransferase n=1 Tax=unclassified Herbaspirillum TaxID=2624150 RepID=UPI001613A1D7|nr:hypothetical protein [Herbaspirillum sp. Sphag1AN]MBB3245275.1 hypothetical protein [Herbaspirillum sp. Sphag64]
MSAAPQAAAIRHQQGHYETRNTQAASFNQGPHKRKSSSTLQNNEGWHDRFQVQSQDKDLRNQSPTRSRKRAPRHVNPLNFLRTMGILSVLPIGQVFQIPETQQSGKRGNPGNATTDFINNQLPTHIREVRSLKSARSDLGVAPNVVPFRAEKIPRERIKITAGRPAELPPEPTETTLSPAENSPTIENPRHLDNINKTVLSLLHQHEKEILDVEISEKTLLKSAIIFLSINDESYAALARQIQHANDNYGGYSDELISPAMQQKIIRDWIVQNLLGTSIDAVITQKIIASEPARQMRSRDLHQFIMQEAFRAVQLDDGFKTWIVNNVLMEELPMIGFFESYPASNDPDFNRLKELKLHDFEWGHIHAGLRFNQLLGRGIDIDLDDAAELGEMLLAQLQEGLVPAEWWSLFQLPALIRYAQEQPDLLRETGGLLDAEIQGHALTDFARALEKLVSDQFPLQQLTEALDNFETRPEMAKQTIKQICPGMPVDFYLNNNPAQCLSKDASKPRSLPGTFWRLNGIKEIIQMPDINEKFQAQIENISALYKLVDKAFLLTAWNQLNVDDFDFIGKAELRWAKVSFAAPSHYNKTPFLLCANQKGCEAVTRHPIPGAEFIVARQPGKAERIYVLHNKGQVYELKRIDRNIEEYYPYFSLDPSSRQYPLYQLQVTPMTAPFCGAEQDLSQRLEPIATKHSVSLAELMNAYGYQKTTSEQIKEILVDLFVPFVGCASAASKGNTGQMVLSCSIDAISLIPLIGNLAKLSIRLGQFISFGSIVALRSAIAQTALRQSVQKTIGTSGSAFVRHALLPASHLLNKPTLPSLGLDGIRALDAFGVELIASIGTSVVKQSLQMSKNMLGSVHRRMHVLERMEQQLANLPSPLTADRYVTAHWRGMKTDVPIVMLSTERYNGKPIYVRVNPDSGERFGRKYLLLEDGTLEPVPVGLAVHLQNIAEQGLSGRGSLRINLPLEDKDNFGALLFRKLQEEISNGETLEKLASDRGLGYHTLRPYLSDTGELTPLGKEIVNLADLAEARSPSSAKSPGSAKSLGSASSSVSTKFLGAAKSHSSSKSLGAISDNQEKTVRSNSLDVTANNKYGIHALVSNVLRSPVLSLGHPLDVMNPLSSRSIKENEAVKKSLFNDGDAIKDIEGAPYRYNIDLDCFTDKKYGDFKQAYLPRSDRTSLKMIKMPEAITRATSISLDERSGVIKALGIDLDLVAILGAPTSLKPAVTEIPKRISYIWVGNKKIAPLSLTKLHLNCAIANEKGYQVRFYLSNQAKSLNLADVQSAMCGDNPAKCLSILPETNKVKILEETELYKTFSQSDNFAQYQDAIDGNGGVATNFASAADILKLVILKQRGGIVEDLDDMLLDTFGSIPLATGDDGIVLGDLLSNVQLDMHCQFGNSFFGSHPGNPLIDEMLKEIHRRYQEPDSLQFYKQPRPANLYSLEMSDYAKKLSYLTGPDVLNTVLFEHFPDIYHFVELEKLKRLCDHPLTSQILISLAEKLPRLEEIAPLSGHAMIGSDHSWLRQR